MNKSSNGLNIFWIIFLLCCSFLNGTDGSINGSIMGSVDVSVDGSDDSSEYGSTNKEDLYRERRLHSSLLKGYNKNIRPAPDYAQPVKVEFQFGLEEINSLDVREQSLDVSAFLTLSWIDPQLQWSIGNFTAVFDTVMDPEDIWTPDVTLYNKADPAFDPLKYARKTKVRLESNGELTWVLYTNWKGSCETDVTNWPFDSHICDLKFGSLMYDNLRLEMSLGEGTSDYKNMSKSYHGVNNGEWKLTNVTSKLKGFKFRCCKRYFNMVKVEITLERYPLYYLLYILLPLVALVFIFLLIFFLDIGQRASYGVTILLSISVYLLVISDVLPEKSDNYPIIGLVFISHFFLLCLALPLAEIGAHLGQRTQERPPRWTMRLLNHSIDGTHIVSTNGSVNNVTYVGEAGAQTNGSIGPPKDEVVETKDYSRCWRKIGRVYDIVCATIVCVLLIVVPLILASAMTGGATNTHSDEFELDLDALLEKSLNP